MSGVNKVILVGNVGQDPEYKAMPNGDGVINLSIATSESWKDKNTGEKKEKTEWHRVVMFRKLADLANQYVKKGSKLYLEGKLQTRSWEQDGVKRYTTEINAHEMQFLDSKPSGGQPAREPAQSQQAQQQTQPAPANFDNFDDDIPF